MCCALWPRPNHHLFPPSQIPDMPLLFPLAQCHWCRLSVLLCAHHHHHHHHRAPLCSNAHFIFLKTDLGPRPLKTATPLMGESLNVHAWEACERVLSVVNNKQNHYIPAAYKQRKLCWISKALLWRLCLSGSSWLFLYLTLAIRRLPLWPSDPLGLRKGGGGTNWSSMAVEWHYWRPCWLWCVWGVLKLPTGSHFAPVWFNLSQNLFCLCLKQWPAVFLWGRLRRL